MKNIKDIRLKHYDYSTNGHYFVTICSNERLPILPRFEEVIKNNLEFIKKIEGVMVDYWVVMPDHIHMIIILNNCQMKLGEIVRRFKAKISKDAGLKVWQPNYYEHVIRNEMALHRIREYIQGNPMGDRIDFKQFYE